MESYENKIINSELLFRYMFLVSHNFPIVPADNPHLGASIAYQDIHELRNEFVEQLYDTIVDWVYSSDKYERIKVSLKKKGKSEASAASEIIRRAKEKFRNSDDDSLLVQGQFGELLLFHFLQKHFKAAPLLRKMPITTSSKLERFGADAIHYKRIGETNIIFLGEAKTYSSHYSFSRAFSASIDSILETYEKHKKELDLYLHEDFLDEEMNLIATKYQDNELENTEVHLVSIVIYNENRKLKLENEQSIKNQIDQIITSRLQNFDNTKIPIEANPILSRITYIVFPIWRMEELLLCFQNYLKH